MRQSKSVRIGNRTYRGRKCLFIYRIHHSWKCMGGICAMIVRTPSPAVSDSLYCCILQWHRPHGENEVGCTSISPSNSDSIVTFALPKWSTLSIPTSGCRIIIFAEPSSKPVRLLILLPATLSSMRSNIFACVRSSLSASPRLFRTAVLRFASGI